MFFFIIIRKAHFSYQVHFLSEKVRCIMERVHFVVVKAHLILGKVYTKTKEEATS